jgi:hypothetical protein
LENKGQDYSEQKDILVLEKDHQYLLEKGKSSGQPIDEPMMQIIGNEFSCSQSNFEKYDYNSKKLQEDSLQILESPHLEDIHEMFNHQHDGDLTILHTCRDQLVSREHIDSSFEDSDIPIYDLYEDVDNELHDERLISIFKNENQFIEHIPQTLL